MNEEQRKVALKMYYMDDLARLSENKRYQRIQHHLMVFHGRKISTTALRKLIKRDDCKTKERIKKVNTKENQNKVLEEIKKNNQQKNYHYNSIRKLATKLNMR